MLFRANETEVVEKIKQVFSMENRSTVDLLNLLDYLDERMNKDIKENQKTTGFLLQIMFDALYDAFFNVIHNVINEKDPIAYENIMREAIL